MRNPSNSMLRARRLRSPRRARSAASRPVSAYSPYARRAAVRARPHQFEGLRRVLLAEDNDLNARDSLRTAGGSGSW